MKKKLLRIATSICLVVSLMLLGQMSAYADEVEPIHEYLFDSEMRTLVVDSGSDSYDGVSYGANHEKFVTGYNDKGKARYFNGIDDYLMLSKSFPVGAKSIRFKMKKNASTATDKLEAIFSSNATNLTDGYFIGIGSVMLNYREGGYPNLTARKGTLYIASFKDNTINYEIQTPESICDGQWHDILLTWDGGTNTNSVKLYLDNMTSPVAQTTAVYTSDGNKYNSALHAGKISSQFVENNYDTGERLWYNGYLDDVQIYDSAITPSSETSSNLKATGGDSKVYLIWNAVTDATSYTIKRSTTARGPYISIATDVTDTNYTDKDVTNGITYYYVVSAIANGSEGWSSNEASATPQTTADPNQPIVNKALLVITMVTGEQKEYEMTPDEINDFITWYNSKAATSPTYMIDKDYNRASFISRKDYIAYEQISNFEINEYNA